MAEIENITILRIDTGEAVRNVGDLKDNIKALKGSLDNLEIGTQEYQDTLSELRVNQNALRDAMYATSASMEDVAKSATGASESYNGLVNRMKSLKEEFRSTNDEVRRQEIGAQIKAVNDQLKELDALQGNFQRNVGNYAGSIKAALKDVPSFAAPVKGAIDNIDKSMGLLSKNPLLGILTLLFPLITKITDGLKDNKTAIDAVNKAMKALEPVFNVITQTVETIAGWLGKAVDWLLEFADRNKETFKNFISGAVGVGNAVLQYILTPIRTTIEAVKGLGNVIKDVFTGQWKKIKEDAGGAIDGIKDAFKKGFDFKGNFAEGKRIGGEWIAGLMSVKPKANDAGKAIGTELGKGIAEGLDAMDKEIDAAIERDIQKALKAEEQRNKIARDMAKQRLDQIGKDAQEASRIANATIDDEAARQEALYNIQQDANQRRLDAMQKFYEDALSRGDVEAALQYQKEAADLSVEIELDAFERREEIRRKEKESADKVAKAKLQTLNEFAAATSSILESLADMYEEDAEASAASANRVKGLRIAAAAIDTISGAVGAYMQAAATIPPPYGIIVGALQAATVTASGIANIAKMKATKIDASGKTSTPSIGATVSAPRVNVEPQQTTVLQSASEELKLNERLQDQKVYILESDIEAKGNSRRVKVAESSF